MKKILILSPGFFGTGGIQKYGRYLCRAFESEFDNYSFTSISLTDTKKDATENWSNNDLKYCGRLSQNLLRKMSFFIKALSAVLRERPCFLVCAHINLSGIALFFKKVFGLKYAVFAYGIDIWRLKKGKGQKALQGADAIIAISRYTKRRIMENGISEAKIEVLANSIDTDLFFAKKPNRELLDSLGLHGKRILLTVGRMDTGERYKGHDAMLEVMQRLDDSFVWLVVGGGNDLPRLQQKAEQLGLSKKIKFVGRISDEELIDYYNLCDLFIMPSSGEGFGFVFLEALACGKPIIGGKSDGSTEPLMDGKLGFLVDSGNIDEIIDTIRSVFRNKEDRANPEYLREMVKENFGVEVFNRRAKELFNTIL